MELSKIKCDEEQQMLSQVSFQDGYTMFDKYEMSPVQEEADKEDDGDKELLMNKTQYWNKF